MSRMEKSALRSFEFEFCEILDAATGAAEGGLKVMERYTWREHGKPRLRMGDTEFVGGPIIEKFTAYEDSGLTPAEAAELTKAKAEGRLVKWPCSLDKSCYAIASLNCEYMDCPNQDENGDCENNCPNIVVVVDPEKTLFADLIRLPLYATREEAEAALTKQEGNL